MKPDTNCELLLLRLHAIRVAVIRTPTARCNDFALSKVVDIFVGIEYGGLFFSGISFAFTQLDCRKKQRSGNPLRMKSPTSRPDFSILFHPSIEI